MLRVYGALTLFQGVSVSALAWIFGLSFAPYIGLFLIAVGSVLTLAAVAEFRTVHRNIEKQKASANKGEDPWIE